MKAVVTICIGEEYQKMMEITRPQIVDYAKKIDAVYIEITERKYPQYSPHFEKYQLKEILTQFDRVVYIDSDCIVSPDCPNLFDIVPEDHIGACDEIGIMKERMEQSTQEKHKYQSRLLKRPKTYYNTGVLVLSKQHSNIFDHMEKGKANYEQDFLNKEIKKHNVFDIGRTFNGVNVHWAYPINLAIGKGKIIKFDNEEVFFSNSRFDNHIIHYAGHSNKLHAHIKEDSEIVSRRKRNEESISVRH